MAGFSLELLLADRASASARFDPDFMMGTSHLAQVHGIAVLLYFEGGKLRTFQGGCCRAVKLTLVLHPAGKPGRALPPLLGHSCSSHSQEHAFLMFSMVSVPWGCVFSVSGFVPAAVFILACFLFIADHGWSLVLFSSSEAFGSDCL